VQAAWVTRRKQDTEEGEEERSWAVQHLVSMLLPSLAFVAGGLSLIAGGGGGLYWALSAVLLAFVVASVNAWALLVEIVR
jgi:modulator of FtsH protease